MDGKISRRAALATLATAALGATPVLAQQSQQVAYTTIQVKDMHCAHCAQKIAGRLYTVAGVQKVQADLKTHRAFVTPQPQRQPSPKAMWNAVVAAGFQPVSLVGPYGQFTSPPEQ